MRAVAFLRAINVGGGHVVKMDVVRQIFEAAGATNVATFIASGNVIFDTPRRNLAELEGTLERALEKALGFPVTTFVRSTAEVSAVAGRIPFPDPQFEAGSTMYVGFLKDAPGKDACKAVLGLRNAVDDFAIHGRECYWLRRNHLGESNVTGTRLEKALAAQSSSRNVTTIRNIAAKFCEER
jgi:uncharacterized protein (DUF1697 family)